MATTKIPAEFLSINAISGTLIADNAITTVHIAQNAITSVQIPNNSIGTVQIALNTVTSTHIAQNQITTIQLANNSVQTLNIADDQVTAAKLADAAVVTASIVDLNVTEGKIAANAITASKIPDGSITATQIGANAVTLAKMASLTRGSILIGNSAADVAALTIGSNGTVLKSDGTDIAWAADSVLTTEQVQDITGAMFSSNTETGIAATYQDGDGTVDLVIGANVIVAGMIASNSILTRHIDDDQVTGAQLADALTVVTSVTTPLVDAAIVDGENFKVNGGQGNDGQVLTSTGSGAAWEDAGGGSVSAVANGANNRITTFTSADALNGEANLTFTGSVLQATGSANVTRVGPIGQASGAVQTWDVSAAANTFFVPSDNNTVMNPGGTAVAGAIIQVEIAMGSTVYAIAWQNKFKFSGDGSTPTVTATANKTDIFTFRYNGTVWQEIGRVQNLAQTV